MAFAEYPKMKYSRVEGQKVVQNAKEEAELDGGWWYDKPDFTNWEKPASAKFVPLDKLPYAEAKKVRDAKK